MVPFLWLLPGTVALAGTKILAAYVFSRGQPMINAWIALVTLIVTIVGRPRALSPSSGHRRGGGRSFGYCVSLVLTAIAYRASPAARSSTRCCRAPPTPRSTSTASGRCVGRLLPAAAAPEANRDANRAPVPPLRIAVLGDFEGSTRGAGCASSSNAATMCTPSLLPAARPPSRRPRPLPEAAAT